MPRKMCTNLAVRQGGGGSSSSKDPGRGVALLVEAVLLLRQLLRCLGPLADSLAWVDATLLRVRGTREGVTGDMGKEKLEEVGEGACNWGMAATLLRVRGQGRSGRREGRGQG
jgi:hypothetical protein